MSASEPGWRADPTGRHEYRWWNGAGWGAAVADGGVEGYDPIGAAPPTPAVPVPPLSAEVPPVMAPAPPSRPGSGLSSGVLVVIGVVILTLIGVVVGLVVARDGDSGSPSASETDETGGASETTAAPAEPLPPLRDMLLDVDDLPVGWEDGPAVAPTEDQAALFCDQERPDDLETPSEIAETNFERQPTRASLRHQLSTQSVGDAGQYIDAVVASAGACETWTEESETDGVTYEDEWSAVVVGGPPLGDQSAWIEISLESHPQGDDTQVSTNEGRAVVFRHGGVVTVMILGVETFTDADQDLIEQLATIAADRLAAGG